MISTIGWIAIVAVLLIIATITATFCSEFEDEYGCYKKNVYACLNCKKNECPYHKKAEKAETIVKKIREKE